MNALLLHTHFDFPKFWRNVVFFRGLFRVSMSAFSSRSRGMLMFEIDDDDDNISFGCRGNNCFGGRVG